MFKFVTIVGSFSLMVLAGCSETSIMQVDGRPAATPQECEAVYKERMSTPVNVNYTSGPGLIGSAIGAGLARGTLNSAYSQCLERVGYKAPLTTEKAKTTTSKTGKAAQ